MKIIKKNSHLKNQNKPTKINLMISKLAKVKINKMIRKQQKRIKKNKKLKISNQFFQRIKL